MIWYCIFLLICCSTLYISRKADEKCLISQRMLSSSATFLGVTVTLFMAFFAGFRDHLGTDYDSYVSIYDNLTWDQVVIDGNIEIGYSFLNMFVKTLVDYYPIAFTLAAFIMYFPIYLACRRESVYIELSLFLYVCFGLFINSFNIMRQYMAAGILFYAWRFVYQKRAFVYFVYVAVAMMFHKAAIVMIPAYFVVRYIKGKHADLMRLAIVICAVIIMYKIRDVYAILYNILPSSSKYREYFNPENIVLNDARGLTFPLFSVIVYIMYRISRKKHGTSEKLEQQINILTLGFFFSAIGQRVEIILRLQIFFVPIMIILIPNLICTFKNKQVWYFLVILSGIAYFLMVTSTPYRSILFGGI